MTFPVLPANGPSGYNLTNSLRFRSSASAYLNRTFSTPTNNKIWTWSAWVKRGSLVAASRNMLGAGTSGTNYCVFTFLADQTLYFQNNASSGNQISAGTTAVFRDPSAWYHLVLAVDTTQATNSNGVRIWVNGVQQTLTFGTYTQNTNTIINASGVNVIGDYINGGGGYFDGYMAEINFIDGQALTPSSFGSTNAVTGVWQPAKYAGTYGTNGFYLPFTNTTSTTTLGNDFSGNGNNWTTNNISLTPGATYDAMTDVPTLTSATAANYCVLNPLYSTSLNGGSILNGNLDLNCLSGGATSLGQATIHSTSGKYYFEVTGTTNGGFGQVLIAIQTLSNGTLTAYVKWMGTGGDTGYTTYGTYGVAYDVNAGKMWIKDTTGAWTSGDPTTGASPLYTFTANIETYPYAGSSRSSGSNNPGLGSYNFGQRPFAYTPPSGFVALNTFNLLAGTITTSGTFTGNSSTDGPFVYLNGVPTAMTINGNAVTFGTHADKLANGFKVRSSTSSYNTSGSNTYSVTSTGAVFKNANAQGNP